MNDWAIQLKNTKHIPKEKIRGTALQGYVDISLNDLRKLFGEETRKNTDPIKTHFEWDLECDGIIFTIYDYYTWEDENDINPDEQVTFHIGGLTKETADFVYRLIKYNID